MTHLVRVEGVRRAFVGRAETVVALDDVSVSVAPGEVVGVAGPSGSGKTTMLDVMLGWERPDAGTVVVDDDVVRRPGWTGIAVVPQELGLLPELTGRQNVDLALRLSGCTDADVGALLERLGLADLGERLPDDMSLGEQQRFAVARAVAPRPRLLLADEPTAHQDEAHADVVMAVLRGVGEAGGAVVVATHDERLLDRVDRIVWMLDGRVDFR